MSPVRTLVTDVVENVTNSPAVSGYRTFYRTPHQSQIGSEEPICASFSSRRSLCVCGASAREISVYLPLSAKKCRGEPRHFHFGKEISQRRRRTARTDRRPRQWCCSCYPWRCINRRTGRRSPCTQSCRGPWWCRSCRFWWRTSSQYRQQQRSKSCSQRRRCKRWRQQPRKRR